MEKSTLSALEMFPPPYWNEDPSGPSSLMFLGVLSLNNLMVPNALNCFAKNLPEEHWTTSNMFGNHSISLYCDQHWVRHGRGGGKNNCTSRFLPSNTPGLIGKLWKNLLCDQLLTCVELKMIKGEIHRGLLSQEVFMGNGRGCLSWALEKILDLYEQRRNKGPS